MRVLPFGAAILFGLCTILFVPNFHMRVSGLQADLKGNPFAGLATAFIGLEWGIGAVAVAVIAVLFSGKIAESFGASAVAQSRTSGDIQIENAVREALARAKVQDRYITAHKPAFAYNVVYDVQIGHEKRRFKSKADAVAFCLSQLPHEASPQSVSPSRAAP